MFSSFPNATFGSPSSSLHVDRHLTNQPTNQPIAKQFASYCILTSSLNLFFKILISKNSKRFKKKQMMYKNESTIQGCHRCHHLLADTRCHQMHFECQVPAPQKTAPLLLRHSRRIHSHTLTFF